MIYKYPTIQNVQIGDSLLVMASTFDSGRYTSYIVDSKVRGVTDEEGNNIITTYEFMHNDVLKHLKAVPTDRAIHPGVADGQEQFIRLRLHVGSIIEND